jgi:hypothetical protein
MNTLHNKNKKISKKLIITSVAVLACIAVFAGYYFVFGNTQAEDHQQLQIEKEVGDRAKSATVNNSNNQDEKQSNSDQPPAPVPQQNGKSTIEVLSTTPLSNASYKYGETIQIRVSISGKVTTGTCTLTLQKPGSTLITKTAEPFQSGAQTSTCKGFDILSTEVGRGTWSYLVNFNNESLEGSTQGSFVIE